MKRETLKQKYGNRRPLAVYSESAFSGYAIYDIETGFEMFVIVARFIEDKKKFFRRPLETEFPEDENAFGKDFFRLYGEKFYLEDFGRV